MIDLVDASLFEPALKAIEKVDDRMPIPYKGANLRTYGVAEAMP
jgi:hypothetical protein